MSDVLRFIFYFIIFLVLFRLLRRALRYLFSPKNNPNIKNQPRKKKSKFEDIEDAKFTEIKPEDENKN